MSTRAGRAPGREKPPQLRSLTPRTLPVRPEPTPQGRRHWCRLTEKYCTRIATPFQNYPLLPIPFSLTEPSIPVSSRVPILSIARPAPRFTLFLTLSRSGAVYLASSSFPLPLSVSLFLFIFPPGHPGSSRYST